MKTAPKGLEYTLADHRAAMKKAGKPCQFFLEYVDTTTYKSYGIQIITSPEKIEDWGRQIGVYGTIERKFIAPFWVLRGHRIVKVQASKNRPITVNEFIYPFG